MQRDSHTIELNRRAAELCDRVVEEAMRLRVAVETLPGGSRVIDCGVQAPGGLEAGLRLAEVCMSGLANVQLLPANPDLWSGWSVAVATDHPVAACMASQYAGWEVTEGKFYAMGSGPMRAAAQSEELFNKIGYGEESGVAVGVLESGKLPGQAIAAMISAKCRVPESGLTLLVAPTRSQAGTVQIVARSVETALHKLHELGFELARVESGLGVSPLPPVAADDLQGIGRTNDAILYGAEVTLYVRGDDESLQAIGPKVPSSASPDHGQPFAALFERCGNDFYKIDPLLFSPAVVSLFNLDTGRAFRYGHTVPRILHESFGAR